VRHHQIVGSLLLLLTLLLVPEAWGAVRYVSTSGTDNLTCTQAAPCRHIQRAVDIASHIGDTISIGKGKFPESGGVIITKNLTLNGAGIFSTRVHGAGLGFSIFRIEPGVTVTIADLDIMDGDAEHGGGIWNGGNLTLERVRVWKNRAKQGGGIFNAGALKIYRSEIARNSASDSGGGLYNENFTILDEVRIVVNYADPGKSGGIENRSQVGFSLVETERSEISHNSGHGIGNWGNMSLTNTTVSRNKQAGIFVADGFDTELVHVTVAENGGGGLHLQVGTDSIELTPSIVLINTIVANNTPVQCIFPSLPFSPSSTNSLSSDMTCQLSPGSIAPVDPKLGPLKSNGGLTFTHALKLGSPAIDAGWPEECEPVDQRGVLRLIDGNGDGAVNCDIGAFEYLPWKRLEQ
jgi:hypothetical protein